MARMTTVGRAVEDYLALRRALGFAQKEDAPQLRDFARFLEAHGASHITVHLAKRWAQLSPAGPARWATRLGWVRRLALHLSASDAKTEIPPAGLFPPAHRRKQPYLYTDLEVRRLLAAAQRLRSETGLRPATYSTLIGLLAVTGLRISEAIALNDPDVDLGDGAITIRRTKFRKSRLVTLHASTIAALRQYLVLRDQACPRRPNAAFLVGETGRRLTKSVAEWTFAKLSRQTGLRGLTDRRGPRLHDFRHRLAVTTLIRWYRSGLNVEAQLPVLATYLGHAQISGTYWYLTAVPDVPELLRLAADRLGHRRDLR